MKELEKESLHVFDKTLFSMLTPPTLEKLKARDVQSVVLFGIEAHVCVQQTALQCLEMGIDCHVLVDGVSSQRSIDRSVALQVRYL